MIERAAGGRIKAYETFAGSDPQSTAGSEYNQMLQERRDQQAAQKIPRSQGSWASEQERLGSWHSGVGKVTPVGQGNLTPVGHGRQLFNLDEEKARP